MSAFISWSTSFFLQEAILCFLWGRRFLLFHFISTWGYQLCPPHSPPKLQKQTCDLTTFNINLSGVLNSDVREGKCPRYGPSPVMARCEPGVPVTVSSPSTASPMVINVQQKRTKQRYKRIERRGREDRKGKQAVDRKIKFLTQPLEIFFKVVRKCLHCFALAPLDFHSMHVMLQFLKTSEIISRNNFIWVFFNTNAFQVIFTNVDHKLTFYSRCKTSKF